jgi:hypothetical protein
MAQMHPKRIANPSRPFSSVGDKQLKKIQKAAWDAGWWPEQKKRGLLWLAPDEVGQVILHGSASDRHALANALSEFRKAGLDV